MAVETELPRKLRFLMGGKAIQTKLDRETYLMTNLPHVMYLGRVSKTPRGGGAHKSCDLRS